jgi:site-specific DNA recombinase
VPPIIDETAFALATEQLESNKRFARRRTKEPSLLQGMLVCRRCGYAYYRTSTRTTKRKIYYYRCIGSDDYRWDNGRICSNKPVRQDHLDELVWEAVIELLADPSLAKQELDERLAEQRRSNPTRKQKRQLRTELLRYQKAVARLIEAYQEELISLDELRERIPELRQKENAARAQLETIEARLIDEQAHLRLADSLETFLKRLRKRAQTLSVEERQQILRLVVKEVQVDGDKLIIKHSIPTSGGGYEPSCRLRWRSH